MRSLLLFVLGCSVSVSAAAALYRHVDDAGKVTYSDRPQQPHQEPLRLPPPNVATPEARRQLDIARQASEREEQAEYEARIRRWAAAHRATPAAYSRPLSSSTPRYAGTAYYPYSYPSFTTFSAATPAGSSGQSHSHHGLRSAGGSHRAHHARR
jgi:hypothetical protein